MSGELIVAALSLLLSISVAISQVLLWRREGGLLRCRGAVENGALVIVVQNVGRGTSTVSGYGFTAAGRELPWATDVATRYWRGASQLTTPGLPRSLGGRASERWSIPLDEIRSYLDAAEITVNAVRPFVIDGVGKRRHAKAEVDLRLV